MDNRIKEAFILLSIIATLMSQDKWQPITNAQKQALDYIYANNVYDLTSIWTQLPQGRCTNRKWGYACHMECFCSTYECDMYTGYCGSPCEITFLSPIIHDTYEYSLNFSCTLKDLKDHIRKAEIRDVGLVKSIHRLKDVVKTEISEVFYIMKNTDLHFSTRPSANGYIVVDFQQPVKVHVVRLLLPHNDPKGQFSAGCDERKYKLYAGNSMNSAQNTEVGEFECPRPAAKNIDRYFCQGAVNNEVSGTKFIIEMQRPSAAAAPVYCRVIYVFQIRFFTCVKYTYGPFCLRPCGRCRNMAQCSYTGECPGGCEFGVKNDQFCNDTCKAMTWGANCGNQCGKGCLKQCDYQTGDCQCSSGYLAPRCDAACAAGNWGAGCAQTCGNCATPPCNNIDGGCGGKCAAGFKGFFCTEKCAIGTYGENCNFKCHFCKKRMSCDTTTGFCDPKRCLAGYHGDKCDEYCPSKSFGPDCSETCNCYANYTCNSFTGDCGAHGCSSQWTGKQCNVETLCPIHQYGKRCKNCGWCQMPPSATSGRRCDLLTGECPRGCLANFVGKFCHTCKPKTYGRHCYHKCENCRYDYDCHHVTGVCGRTGCKAGFYGAKCDIVCGRGRYGYDCANLCSKHCLHGECDPRDGTCLRCSSGWKGTTCKEMETCTVMKYGAACNIKCGHCRRFTKCAKLDGRCLRGCDAGYLGENCRQRCVNGFYGRNCRFSCGHCSNWEFCDKITGNCRSGCLGKRIAPKCAICPDNYFGPECEETCGHCKYDKRCHKQIGVCPDGCAPGFTGHFCKERLSAEGKKLKTKMDSKKLK